MLELNLNADNVVNIQQELLSAPLGSIELTTSVYTFLRLHIQLHCIINKN